MVDFSTIIPKMNKLLNFYRLLCYNDSMRQKFDIGDLVETTYPQNDRGHERGIVLDTEPINKSIDYSGSKAWHPDEYKCKVQFITIPEVRWVRAKWLTHLSKIN